jgi:16S rRNA (cytidine1402-2'-O)-methyltransferase
VLVIEGKSEEELAIEEKESWQELSVRQHVDMHIASGLSEKDAIKLTAKERGLRKQDVYIEIKG